MTRKFRSLTGYQITVFMPNRPDPIYVPAEGCYETDDPSVITWLDGSQDVGVYVDLPAASAKAVAPPEPAKGQARNKATRPPAQFQPGRGKGR